MVTPSGVLSFRFQGWSNEISKMLNGAIRSHHYRQCCVRTGKRCRLAKSTHYRQQQQSPTGNVSVNAKVEGRTDGPSGAEWTTLQSTGTAEQDFLKDLIENITGAASPTRP